MRVLVTRPAAQAHAWVDRLRDGGVDAVALPLIGIEPAVDPQPVRQAWLDLSAQRLVAFVSPNAVEHFFRHRPADAGWPLATLAGSPGPGTSKTLMALGVPPSCLVAPASDSPQFDSEALWSRLSEQDWNGRQALVVRGDGGREWLAQTLRQHGAQVRLIGAYRRAAPRFDAAQASLLDAAIAHPSDHLWFFSSSEAIRHLSDARPRADWSTGAAAATHPRIAEQARAVGFGRVDELRPSFEAVLEGLAWSIQSAP
ncbi:MAG: uroporphyrinogen synthase [Rhizobacter sp.]|nr:uroporphyrinogen synthase [Rhizobacter sp.]